MSSCEGDMVKGEVWPVSREGGVGCGEGECVTSL